MLPINVRIAINAPGGLQNFFQMATFNIIEIETACVTKLRKDLYSSTNCSLVIFSLSYMTLETLCQYLEEVAPEQEFSIRTLGRALDRWDLHSVRGYVLSGLKKRTILKTTPL